MKSIDNKACIKILHHEKVPIHIIRHCVVVSRVSCKIAYNLSWKDYKLDIDIIRAGALLHDVAKVKAMKQGEDHAEMGARLLESMDHPRIAEIIREHVFLKKPIEKQKNLSEELVVNYADKRVMHTMVVSLDVRFRDLLTRYGKNQRAVKKIYELFEQTRLMEEMIFSQMDIKPEEI